MSMRFWQFARKDIINAIRNNMVLYGVLFPILLALALRLFLPSVQEMKLTIAVHSEIDAAKIEKLRSYARVELFKTEKQVRERVNKPDDVAGIILSEGKTKLVLEGNENGDAEGISLIVLKNLEYDFDGKNYTHISVNKNNSPMKSNAGGLLLLSSILIGGLIVGMNIVDEKETGAIMAIAVSPVKMLEFVASHALLCLLSGVALGTLSGIILSGFSINYGKFLISMLASTGIGMIMGFMIGGFADNMISAIAVLKIIVLVFIGVPMGSMFVPQHLQWVFYIFPHYWSFNSYRHVYNGVNIPVSFNIAVILGFVTSIIGVILLLPYLKKSLKLR